MRILSIMDPLNHLDLIGDTSLIILNELNTRGHETWFADVPDLFFQENQLFASAKKLSFHKPKLDTFNRGAVHYKKNKTFPFTDFDLVLVRKDPPFDAMYLHMTYLLNFASAQVPMINHPTGIRNFNEKIALLPFKKWAPPSCVTASADQTLAFQAKIQSDLVIKPLDNRGGKGVMLIPYKEPRVKNKLQKIMKNKSKLFVAQKFIRNSKHIEDKRILLLNGKVISAHLRRPTKKGEFRANVSLGGSFHSATISVQEKQMIKEVGPALQKQGLYFVGLDTIDNRLIEINVTSPAGLYESRLLYPQLYATELVADFLENFPKAWKVQRFLRS